QVGNLLRVGEAASRGLGDGLLGDLVGMAVRGLQVYRVGCLTGLTPLRLVASRNSLGSRGRAVIMDRDSGAGGGGGGTHRRVDPQRHAGWPPHWSQEIHAENRTRNPMNAIPSYATAVTVTLCLIVVAVMAAISYVAARQHGSDHRSALAVTLGVGAILAAWLAATAALGGAEVFLGRPGNAAPAIAGGVAIPIV